MMDSPSRPTWDHPDTPTRQITQAERESAARQCRRHAQSPTEADTFLSMLGLVG